ncbi:MAG: glycosyltransferase N-terminal domain-containing protein [Kiritimatiellia bacterium]|jgi:3-deoxy-D-manno-octulosonic-acid transferase|nr:glycosyltransferase N-terminal domain-containing protein [Kiritimatiellia bacterium]MDP6848409.1 glycosyltransferase N-terminal domain-containing protein [Kiritimatiellia bacterium]
MIWFAYNIIFTLGYLLLLPRFLFRMCRRGGYMKDFMQRFGMYREEVRSRILEKPRIWVHAVSVGEIYVAASFIKECRLQRPESAFILSTTTSTGHAIAGGLIADDDVLIYFPVDFPPIVRRVLDLLRPKALVLTESEMWPNLIRISHSRNIPVVMMNGRISDHSYRGYQVVRGLFSRVAGMMNALYVQGRADREKLVSLGASEDRVHVMGSAKYDMTGSATGDRSYVRDLLLAAGLKDSDLILLGGSTWHGEEAALLGCFRRLKEEYGNVFLVLVPRHVERTRQVVSELKRSGLRWVLRSTLSAGQAPPDSAYEVLLVDTTGELKDFYEQASVVFVGKSLTQHGGQNIIEPAALSKPIVVGPNMENFEAVMSDFLENNAVVQVADARGLCDALAGLFQNDQERDELGRRAQELSESRRGAISATVSSFLSMIGTSKG